MSQPGPGRLKSASGALPPRGVGEGGHGSDSVALVEDGLLKVSEAAAFLRLSRSSLYTLMEQGELPFVKLGRSRRIPKRAIVELAARGLRGGVRVTEVG